MPRPRRALATLLLASLAATAACGSDDGGSGGASVDADAEVDAGALSPFSSAQCTQAVTAMANAAIAASGGLAAGSEDLDESVEALQQMASAAPEQIRADFEIVVDGYRALVKAFADVGFDPASGESPTAAQIEELSALGEQFNDEEFVAASENVTEWFEQNCDTGG